MIWLKVILLILGISVLSWLWANLLIFSMKYGHILGFIKLRWAKSIVDGIEEPSDDLKWSEASSLMDEVYDKVARYDKTFALFDCPYCLSVRIAMILTLMTLPLMWYHLGYGLVFLFTMPLTYKLNDI